MNEFWKRMTAFLGIGVPTEECPPEAQKAAAPQVFEQSQAPANWAIGFDSVLPGVRGLQAVPVGPGRNMMFRFDHLTVVDAFRLFDYMVQMRREWPFGPDAEAFAGYVTLEGMGWDMTVYFPSGTPRVEYFVKRTDGAARASGQVRWELLAQALVLSPDYDAVVGYLTLSPYHMAVRAA
jgi:hypothetical protein